MEQEKIKCACGSKIQKNSLQAHLKSKKHIKFIENPNKFKIIQGNYTIDFN